MFVVLKSVVVYQTQVKTAEMSPAKLPTQAHRVLEIKLRKDFVINLDKRWVWNKSFIPGRQRASLLRFTVRQSLDTWRYVCLPAREFLCKLCIFRIALVIFTSLWYNLLVWIWPNPRMVNAIQRVESPVKVQVCESKTQNLRASGNHSLHTSGIRQGCCLFCTQSFDSKRASKALILCCSFSPRPSLFCSCSLEATQTDVLHVYCVFCSCSAPCSLQNCTLRF